MELKTQVTGLLSRLGTTADEVAENLRKSNVQGIRNAARSLNPIVKYVQVCVHTDAIDMDLIKGDRLSIHFAKGESQEVAIPQPVEQFLVAFNRGHYPDLEAECRGQQSPRHSDD